MEIKASTQIRAKDPITNAAAVISGSTDLRLAQSAVDTYITSGVFQIPLSDLGDANTGETRRTRGVELTFFGTGSPGDALFYNVWMLKYGSNANTDPALTTRDVELKQLLTGGGVLVNIAGSGANTCVKSTEKFAGVLTNTPTGTLLSVLEGCYGSPGTDVFPDAGQIGRLIIPETFGAAALLVDMYTGGGGGVTACGLLFELID